MKRSFHCVDAFCGAGGLSIGLGGAGFNVRYGFDVDDNCILTLRSNPKYIRHEVEEADIRSLLNGRLLQKLKIKPGELELLAGGPPCQGFSVQRIGEDLDDRNNLVTNYASLIQEVRPLFFLMENVLGLGGKRGKTYLEGFIGQMESLGYFIHRSILDAQHFGTPQRRKRMIVVGELMEGDSPFFRFPVPNGKKPKTVREIIGHLPPPPADYSSHPDYPNHRADRLSDLNSERLRFLSEGQSREDLPPRLLAACHMRSAAKIGHRNVYGRMSWDEVAPTITARFDSFTRGKFGHPEQVRTISLYEGALLQTFPKDYLFTGNKVDVARQIGNAVPPNLASALGKAIISALNKGRGT